MKILGVPVTVKNRMAQNAVASLGIITSLYGNLDIGKPYRLRSPDLFSFLNRFYHLTHIGLILTAITLGMCILYRDRCTSNTQKEQVDNFMYKLYPHIFALTITVELFIPISFWVMWHMDKSLVVNPSSYVGEDSISLFFNLCMHGFPTVFLLVEFFYIELLNTMASYGLLFLFFIGYIILMHICYELNGYWPYGVIKTLTGTYRILFFCVCYISICTVYYILTVINKYIWRRTRISTNNKKEKRITEQEKIK
ncbi:hypothetical protein NEIRO03_2604 [Nematocida sp. AWRm78]|nr:hypothetical protein NEIRO02_2603 [Nematocida sp. AWRm79]KAI5187812.1 hypothetical protein NEIRO03_2604 [Nematocida sp. AWRm78]